MISHIIDIGNSRGVRLPAAFLKETGMNNLIEIAVVGKKIIMKAIDSPRKNWENQFVVMHKNNEDKLLDDFYISNFDENEWEWNETV